MAAVTNANSTTSTSNASSYASTSFTPSANTLLFACVYASGTVATTPTMTASANGITFTMVGRQLGAAGVNALYCFVADQKVGGTPAAMTVTFNCSQDAATGAAISVQQITGMTQVGAAAVRQMAGAGNNLAAGATPSVTFASAPLTGNCIIGAVGNGASPATLTPPTNYTERSDAGYSTPTTGLEVASRDSGQTTTAVTWGNTSATAGTVVAVEFDTSASTTAIPTGLASANAFGSTTVVGGASGPTALAQYAFDEGSGTTAAEVNGGTSITGISAWNATGKNGAALQVTGTGPTVAPYSGAGAFTVMAWFYVTSNAGWQSLLESSWLQYLEINGLALDWYDGGMAISGGTLVNNTWNHIALTASGTVNTLYVNGTSVGTNNRNTPSGTGAINIGGSSGQGGNAMRVDDLRFYTSALTQAQIQTLMNTPVAPSGPAATNTSPTAIASGEAHGNPTATITGGGITAVPTGIASAQAFGNPTVTPVTISPTGIASAESFGSTTVAHVYQFPFVAAASANGRRLVDASSNPIINVFDTMWSMVQLAGRDSAGNWQSDMNLWVNTRSGQGFTGLKFCLFAQTINGAPSTLLTHDGVSPFDTTNPSTANIGSLNNTYWQRVDYLVDAAAAAGLTCWIHVMYKDDVSAPSGTGWLQGKTNTQYTNFGTALANRYKSKPNIVWVYGGDYFDESAAQMQLIDTAMKSAGDSHLVTVQNYSDSSGGTFWTTSRLEGPTVNNLTLGNAIATVDGIYIYQDLHLGSKQAYQDTPTIPSVYYDGYYDQNSTAAATRMRKDWGWALTTGVNASHYGSEATWSMGTSWKSNLTNTTGVQHLVSMTSSFKALPGWDALVPDFGTSFITSGRGTGTSFITGSVRADGKLAVIYMPNATGTSVTINQSAMVAGYKAKWVDPTNGATVTATPGATYTKTGANAAGSPDWFLVLQEDPALNLSPTGVASGEAHGVQTATSLLGVNPTAIASALAFGTQTLTSLLAISPTAIVSGEAHGIQTVGLQLGISPTGIATALAFGNPTVSPLLAVSPVAIGSAEGFGNPAINFILTLVPTGFDASGSVGNPTISGVLLASPMAIASALAFGNPTLSPLLNTVPSGIASSEALGTAAIQTLLGLSPTAIASALAFGNPSAGNILGLAPSGIITAEALGLLAASFQLLISPTGIVSAESFGIPVNAGGLTLNPIAINTGLAFGTTVATIQIPLSPTGLASALVFGTTAISSVLNVSASGILTAEALGAPAISSTLGLSPAGIATALAFGTTALNFALIVSPTGVATLVAFGNPTLGGQVVLSPAAIASALAFGNPTTGSGIITEFVGWGIPIGLV